MKRWLISAAVVLSVGTLLWIVSHTEKPVPGSSLLKQVDADGIKKLISGHPLTLVNVWASWCGPCQEEFPDVLKVRETFGADKLNVVFLSLDRSNDLPEAENFLKSQNVNFETYIADSAELVEKLNPDWQGAIPSSFLYAGDGSRLEYWQGETHFTEFESKIRPHLQNTGLK